MLQPTDVERRDIARVVFGDRQTDHANSSRFRAYFEHYCSLVCPSASGDAVIEIDTPALDSHTKVINSIKIITHDPRVSFDDFITQAVSPTHPEATTREKEHVARVAVAAITLVNCLPRDHSIPRGHHLGELNNADHRQVKWEGNMSLLTFMETAFRPRMKPETEPAEFTGRSDMILHKSSLKAWKLIKRCGIKIRATDNLLDHLVLDKKAMTLKVFHQVAFLRAHLAKSRNQPLDMAFEESFAHVCTSKHPSSRKCQDFCPDITE